MVQSLVDPSQDKMYFTLLLGFQLIGIIRLLTFD